MGSSVSRVMESIPSAPDKQVQTGRALGIITSNPGEVIKGKEEYINMSRHGTVKLYKQKFLGLNRVALKGTAKILQDKWKFTMKDFASFDSLVQSLSNDKWVYESNIVEEIETGKDGNTLLFFIVKQRPDDKFDFYVCYLKTETGKYVSAHYMIGGMLTEGLLGKDDAKQLYLVF